MNKLPNFVDMAKTPVEIKEEQMPYEMQVPEVNRYPYGLSICFTEEELQKLDLDCDCEPGDFVHLSCLAKVTSVSKNDTVDGVKSRIEMQITAISVESEEEETEKTEMSKPKPALGRTRPY